MGKARGGLRPSSTRSNSDFGEFSRPTKTWCDKNQLSTIFEKLLVRKVLVIYQLNENKLRCYIDKLNETERNKLLNLIEAAEINRPYGIENDKQKNYRKTIPSNVVDIETPMFPESIIFYENSQYTPKYFDPCDKVLSSSCIIKVNQMFDTESTLQALLTDFEEIGGMDSIFDEQRHGSSHSIIGSKNMDKLKAATKTLNSIVEILCKYFHVQEKEVRINRYLSDEVKPAHQDASAVIDSNASKEQNITIALSLGCSRPIKFEPTMSGSPFKLDINSGDVYAFLKDINLAHTHQVCRSRQQEHTEARFSIIVWGDAKNMEPSAENTTSIERIFAEHGGIFDRKLESCFGHGNHTLPWNAFHRGEFKMEPMAKSMFSDNHVSEINSIEAETDPLSQLEKLKEFCSEGFEMKYHPEDNNRLILSLGRRESYCYCHCSDGIKLRIETTGEGNRKGNAGRKYIKCSSSRYCYEDINNKFAIHFPQCYLYIFDDILHFPTKTSSHICDSCRKFLWKAVVTDDMMKSTDKDVLKKYSVQKKQLYWVCAEGHLNRPFECNCYHADKITPMRLLTDLQNNEDENYGRSYYACTLRKCFFKPRLWRDEIEQYYERNVRIYRKRKIQNKKWSNPASERLLDESLSAESQSPESDCDSCSSDDYYSIVEDSDSSSSSNASTLPKCDCGKKTKITGNNAAICRFTGHDKIKSCSFKCRLPDNTATF